MASSHGGASRRQRPIAEFDELVDQAIIAELPFICELVRVHPGHAPSKSHMVRLLKEANTGTHLHVAAFDYMDQRRHNYVYQLVCAGAFE